MHGNYKKKKKIAALHGTYTVSSVTERYVALQTAVSLKPTLFLALCPESSFPISHPATWTKLRHAERTSIFTQRAAPPTAAWAQTPFRTICYWPRTFTFSLLWRTQTSQLTCHGPSALREAEVWFTLWNSWCDSQSACQVSRYSFSAVSTVCLL